MAPDIFPEGPDTVGLESFFQWLCACVAMVEAGVHFHEDISAVVAVRTLSAAVYGLFPVEAGAPSGVTKAQLPPRRKLLLARRRSGPSGDVAPLGEKYCEELHGPLL